MKIKLNTTFKELVHPSQYARLFAKENVDSVSSDYLTLNLQAPPFVVKMILPLAAGFSCAEEWNGVSFAKSDGTSASPNEALLQDANLEVILASCPNSSYDTISKVTTILHTLLQYSSEPTVGITTTPPLFYLPNVRGGGLGDLAPERGHWDNSNAITSIQGPVFQQGHMFSGPLVLGGKTYTSVAEYGKAAYGSASNMSNADISEVMEMISTEVGGAVIDSYTGIRERICALLDTQLDNFSKLVS